MNIRVQLPGNSSIAVGLVGYAKGVARELDALRIKNGDEILVRNIVVGESSIYIRICNNDSVIRIDGGNAGCKGWYMDSGLADMVEAAPKHPRRGDAGILHIGNNLHTNTMWGNIATTDHKSRKSGIPQEGDKLGALSANYDPVPVGDGILPPDPLTPNATQVELQTWVDAHDLNAIQTWVDGNAARFLSGTQKVNADLLSAWYVTRVGIADALSVKKRAIRDCPASLFHGKLRLLVQSIYGKKFNPLEWEEGSKPVLGVTHYSVIGKSAPSITIATPRTGHPDSTYSLAGNSTVLYTDDEMRYWLIEIFIETGVQIRQLKLSTCGELARQYLLTPAGKALSREDRSKFEAVMLQTAVPDMVNYFSLPTEIPAAMRGTTLAYGWKANWDGSKADIVLHIQRQGPTSADADVYYDASHLALTFKRDTKKTLTPEQTEKDRWTVTGTDSGMSKWMPTVTLHNIWVPTFEGGPGLRVFPPMECGPSRVAPTPINSNAPLYCFYDKNDALQLVTYKQEINQHTTDGVTGECSSYYWGNMCRTIRSLTYAGSVFGGFVASGFSTVGMNRSGGGGLEESWTMGAYPDTSTATVASGAWYPYWDATNKTGDCREGHLDFQWSGDVHYHGVNPDFPAYPFGQCYLYTFNPMYAYGTYTYTIFSGHSETSRATLVIPFGDSECFYCGGTSTTAKGGDTEVAISISTPITLYALIPLTTVGGNPTLDGANSMYINIPGWNVVYGATVLPTQPANRDVFTANYKFIGFNGTHDADPALFNAPNDNPSGAMFDPGTIMAPMRYKPTNHSADQFFTVASAVYGDTIGKTFTTGEYTLPKGDAILKGFIGFA